MLNFRVSQISVFLIASFLIFFIGCRAPSPPYVTDFRVKMEALDVTPFKGKRIVIDPGHGGRFTGAIGKGGLRESDINLTVALHLWGLLKQAGAEVLLTRSADIDLCPAGSKSLVDDLNTRVKLSNEFKADIFISIHHNSNTFDQKKNNIQVFYKLSDPGASQDLANSIASELKKGLPQSEEVFVLPGNYRVLREVEAIAILGEASFISNPQNEERLSLSNQLRKEAEDYFLGIFNYLKKGIPQVIEYHPNNLILNDPFPSLRVKIVGGKGKEAIDPTTLQFYLDAQLVAGSYHPETGIISYNPDKPLTNGGHTFWVHARNFNGNSTWSKPAQFWVSLPPANIKITPFFTSIPPDGKSLTRIEIEVTDEYGNPVIDGTVVGIKASSGKLSNNTITTCNGRGFTHFFSPPESGKVLLEVQAGGVRKKTTISCEPINYGLMQLIITDNQHNPLEGVMVREGDAIVDISDKFGWAFIHSSNSKEKVIILGKSGYESKKCRIIFYPGEFRKGVFTLSPQEGGLLLGKRIILDPEPIVENSQKIFGNEGKDKDLSLLVAQKIQTLLEEAGALTILTRNSSIAHPTPGERVAAGEKFKGEYFITITQRKDDPYIAHYFLSESGKKLAQVIAKVLAQVLNLKEVKVQEGLDFTIIQPSATSILINLGNKGLRQENFIEQAAQSIYKGLVDYRKSE